MAINSEDYESEQNELRPASEVNKAYIKGLLAGICCVFVVIIGFFYGSDVRLTTNPQSKINKGSESRVADYMDEIINKVSDMEEILNKRYLGEIKTEDLVDGMYKGMIDALGDQYAAYWNKEEYNEAFKKSEGIYYGIGVRISTDPDTKEMKIVEVIKNGPSEGSGIKPGDVISAVDGKSIEGIDSDIVINMIKGEKNTDVTVTMFREGESIDFKITRDVVETSTVEGKMINDTVGCIYITSFAETTVQQFSDKFDELKENGMEKLIIDIRNNLGGRLDAVINTLEFFLPKGELIVYTVDVSDKKVEYKTKNGQKIDMPLVVLINGYSASASEIFAGVIKDYGIGTLVGTKTFGKGVVQETYSLKDGSALKFTTSQYYTPNGYVINELGIEPDVEEELSESVYELEEYSFEADNQVQKALEELEKM